MGLRNITPNREALLRNVANASKAVDGNSERLEFVITVAGVNVHDKKTKKTLSVNHTHGKGTYSEKKGKYYYEKAGRNKHGGSWSVLKVEDSRVQDNVSLKKFMSWFFG